MCWCKPLGSRRDCATTTNRPSAVVPHSTHTIGIHIPTHQTDTYYSPEGDRKRLLPLAMRRGLEVFDTRPEWLAYIFERMHRA